MDPGPIDPSVLDLSDTHRASTCGKDTKKLKCIDHFTKIKSLPGDDPRVQALLARAGFLYYSKLTNVRLDHPLITALVERWRPETSTFHLRAGEMTITLQDVAVLLGLRVDGPPVTGSLTHNWRDLCQLLLGRAPDNLRGSTMVKLKWIRQSFPALQADATQVEVEQYTRAYILHQIGCTMFPDMSRNRVHLQWLPLLADLDTCGTLSWGSAVLAYLYNEMSAVAVRGRRRNLIGGCLTLLQLWSWSHLSCGRPSLLQEVALDGHKPFGCRYNVQRSWDVGPDRSVLFYRNELDLLDLVHVQWQPYTDEILQSLPPICTVGAPIWRARTPP